MLMMENNSRHTGIFFYTGYTFCLEIVTPRHERIGNGNVLNSVAEPPLFYSMRALGKKFDAAPGLGLRLLPLYSKPTF
jgi:hypothetical protein